VKHHELKRRAVGGQAVDKVSSSKEPSSPAWKPVTGPKEFSFNVDDNIRGANQHRHEKWDNGTVTGSYAAPGGRNGKWLKYEYIGDANGFRITSTKEVSPEEMMDGHATAKDHQANVNIQTNGDAPVEYTVTEDQLKTATKDAAKDKPIKDKQ